MFSSLPIALNGEYNWFNWLLALLKSIPKYPMQFGFDLWESEDGLHFDVVSQDGFNNRYNYGLRTLIKAENGNKLFIGTANPYQGCEVWELQR